MSSKGDTINNRYHVDEIIGSGAQAVVFLVIDTKENNEK
jgi:hypothetical protein